MAAPRMIFCSTSQACAFGAKSNTPPMCRSQRATAVRANEQRRIVVPSITCSGPPARRTLEARLYEMGFGADNDLPCMRQAGASRLPSEVVLLIAGRLDIRSLARVQQTCKSWHSLLKNADPQLWIDHVRGMLSPDERINRDFDGSLAQLLDRQRNRCFDDEYWNDIKTWQEFCRSLTLLERNWSSTSTDIRCDVLGGFQEILQDDARSAGSSRPCILPEETNEAIDIPVARNRPTFWRARLDPAPDAKFVLKTSEDGGFEVLDARGGSSHGHVLFQLANVPAYAHLEYQDGIACWSTQHDIQVWKRWKLVHGSETEEQRGHFVFIATLPRLNGMRGFMLNKEHHLAIVSSHGLSVIYNVGPPQPQLLNQFSIDEGATGHIEHDEELVVYCMGGLGYVVYRKDTGKKLGAIDFTSMLADAFDEENAPQSTLFLQSHLASRTGAATRIAAKTKHDRAPIDLATMTLQYGHLEDHFLQSAEDRGRESSNSLGLADDEWAAAMLRRCKDGATTMIARSRAGRIFICSNLHGLLSALSTESQVEINAKVYECAALIETGGNADEDDFHEGGWLAANNGRAAWQTGDRVFITPLPQHRDMVPQAGTQVLTFSSQYKGPVPSPSPAVPITFMSLHDDAFFATFTHPAFVRGDGGRQSQWVPWYAKSVRILRFAPIPAPASCHRALPLEDQCFPSEMPCEQRIKILQTRSRNHLRRFKQLVRRQAGGPLQRQASRVALERLRTAQAQVSALVRARGEGRDIALGQDDADNRLPIFELLNYLNQDNLALNFDAFRDVGDIGEDADFDDAGDEFNDLDDLDEDDTDYDEILDESRIRIDGERLVEGRQSDAEDEDEDFDSVDQDFHDAGSAHDVFPQSPEADSPD